MESNKDEALKCIHIAQRHFQNGNYASGRRFCEKSINLFPTPEASKLLSLISEAEVSGEANGTSASSTSAEAHPSASGTRHRHAESSSGEASSSKGTSNGSASKGKAVNSESKRDYTPEQAAIVKRIRACKVTDFYEIMSLKRDCEEVEVKKAYRKLALQLHPDKNGAPGADEAFKMVSKAFQILSDADKRAAYDRHGADPDSRFAGMSTGGGASPGFARSPFQNASFDGEISPEDLFNMFFGGGGGLGGGFNGVRMGGGPGVFTASFGPGGFRTTRVHTAGNGARRAQAHEQDDVSMKRMLAQLAPILILFLFTFLSAIPNLFGPSAPRHPHYSFSPSQRFNEGRETNGLNVKYFVNQAEFSGHPINIDVTTAAQQGKRSSMLNKFERTVENHYTEQVYMSCQRDQERQQRRREAKMGFMGFGADWDAIKQINAEKLPTCEEYNRLIANRR